MVAGIPKQMEIDPSCDHQFGRNRNVTDDYFQFMATSSLTTCAESVEFSHARRAKAAPVRFFAWINSSLQLRAIELNTRVSTFERNVRKDNLRTDANTWMDDMCAPLGCPCYRGPLSPPTS